MAIERFGGDIGVRMRFPLVALDAVPGGSAVWKGAPLEIWATGRADDVALSFHVSDSTTSRGGTSEHTCPSIHTLHQSFLWSSARLLRPCRSLLSAVCSTISGPGLTGLVFFAWADVMTGHMYMCM